LAIPKLPWYDKVRDIVAPTEQAANMVLIAILTITVIVLVKGNPTIKAAWAVWLVMP